MASGNVQNLINNGVQIMSQGAIKGRSLFATRSFKAGEILFEEDPIVSCQFSWNLAYGYAACDHCMKPLETAEENVRRLTGIRDFVLPFPECSTTHKEDFVVCPLCFVTYCSSTCRDKAWQSYHQALCRRSAVENASHPLEQLSEAWKPMHYPPETTSIMLLARILAVIRQAENKDLAKSQFLQLCHETSNEQEEIAHKLLGDQFSSQLDLLLELTTNALGSPETSELLTPEGFRSLFALVGRNGQGIGTSPFSTWVENVSRLPLDPEDRKGIDRLVETIYEDLEKESGDFLNTEGSGLYLFQSSANHSCEPNAQPTFPHSSHRVVVTALRDINEGEEVTISYLDECALSRSRHSRRKILMENYLFVCNCSKCSSEDQADVTSEEDDEDMEDDE